MTGWAADFLAERKRLGLSQKALGAKVGVGYRAVLRWEKEENLPDAELHQEIACDQPGVRSASSLNYPKEEEHRHDLAARVASLERSHGELAAEVARLARLVAEGGSRAQTRRRQ
jgi:transcriptional regulator with XRE-family HTH domain